MQDCFVFLYCTPGLAVPPNHRHLNNVDVAYQHLDSGFAARMIGKDRSEPDIG